MPNTLTFIVLGDPATQGSKRHVGHGILIEANKDLPAWRDSVVTHAKQAARDEGWECADDAVYVALAFTLIRPKSVSPAKRPYPSVKPDLDKVTRAVFDALTIARVIHDDALIVGSAQHKRYCEGNESPGVRVRVSRMLAVGM